RPSRPLGRSRLAQVAALIRGTPVTEAGRTSDFTPKAASHEISKVLEAAIANAEHNHDLAAHELFVKEVTADEGPTLKRFRPRALGRAYRIRKRTSHLHIVVERRGAEAVPRPARSTGGEQAGGRRWRRAQGAAKAGGATPKAPRTRAGRRAAGRSGPETDTKTDTKGGGRPPGPRPATQ